MNWILVGVLVVCVIGLIVQARRRSSLSASSQATTNALADANEELVVVRQELSDAQARLVASEAQVKAETLATEQAQQRAGLAESGLAFNRPDIGASVARAQIEALWAMACLEQSRAWRLTMALPRDPASPTGPDSLAVAVDREVERIREETGTPGRLVAELPDDLDPGDAMIVLKALQGLMAVLTRYSDAFDLSLAQDGERMVATLVCENFDGPDTVADEATALLQALQTARGEIDVGRDEAGRLEARLTVPLSH